MSTVFNSIQPGHVNNRGIRDMSIPDYSVEPATFALHAPVFHVITPKGLLASEHGTQWCNSGDFTSLFGNIMDHKTPYYGPTAACISNVVSAGQSSIGIRRLSGNNELARVALKAIVTTKMIEQYERDFNGNFAVDENGEKIPLGEPIQGCEVEYVEVPVEVGTTYGELDVVVTDIPEEVDGEGNVTVPAQQSIEFPFAEYLAGVGDYYNNCGLNIGVKDSAANWKQVSQFVEATGVFPFTLKMFEDLSTGIRNYVKTTMGADSAQFTLFETEYNSVRYSVKDSVGSYTGTNVNRAVVPRPAPFNDVFVYNESIEQMCQLLWGFEKQAEDNTLVEVGDYKYRQMNPFTAQDHNGSPYYAIVSVTPGLWDTTHAVKAQGGVSPFLKADGTPVEGVVLPEVSDPFNVLGDVVSPFTIKQGWETSNQLMLADITSFVQSLEQEDYVRNRQSFFWDVGYKQEVKEAAIGLLGVRKDIMVIPCATIWDPSGAMNPVADVYGRFQGLVTSLRMYPESEEWGTATCRAAVNLIEAKITNEATSSYFSGNIDLAYTYALFAGGASGMVVPSAAPDHGVNRMLRTMHSPNIEFEESTVNANNFENGGISLRPFDVTGAFFRPALVGVYKTSVDSVLKDLNTNFLCVCIEKIAQDEWNTVSGDTTLSAENYAAMVKDGIERKCRDRLGGIPKQIIAECYYVEDQPGGRAVMNTRVSAWFNKGKYMMNLDLYAYNEQDLES